MFKAFVLHCLQELLGKYFEGLSAEALRISLWEGELVLKDLKIKAEARSLVNLPVKVKDVFIGTIALQAPWKSLGTKPITILYDRVFILAEPAPDGHTLKDKDIKELMESNLEQLAEPAGGLWLDQIFPAIYRSCFKVTISNTRISYADSISDASCLTSGDTS